MILSTFIISPGSCLMTFETELTLLTPRQTPIPGTNDSFVATTQHTKRRRTGRDSSEADWVPRNQQTAHQFRLKRGGVQICLKTRPKLKETSWAQNPRDLFHLKRGKDEGGKDCATDVDRRVTLHLTAQSETKTLSLRSRTQLWKPPQMKRAFLEKILQILIKTLWSCKPVQTETQQGTKMKQCHASV